MQKSIHMSCPVCHDRLLSKVHQGTAQVETQKIPVRHHQTGFPPSAWSNCRKQTPQKAEGTPSLGGFKLNQTWCWATWSKLLLLWVLQILLTQTTLCVNLGPKFVSNQVLLSCCLVLKAPPAWPGSSPGQGPHPCVCLSNSRSSRSCLNTNNNDKVNGKNTVYHLSLKWLFLKQTLVFEDFRAVKTNPRSSPTCTSMRFQPSALCRGTHRNVCWHIGTGKIGTTWKYPSKTSPNAPGKLQGLCCHCFSKEGADCWLWNTSEEQHDPFRSGGWRSVLLASRHNPDFSFEMTCFFISPYGLGCYGM